MHRDCTTWAITRRAPAAVAKRHRHRSICACLFIPIIHLFSCYSPSVQLSLQDILKLRWKPQVPFSARYSWALGASLHASSLSRSTDCISAHLRYFPVLNWQVLSALLISLKNTDLAHRANSYHFALRVLLRCHSSWTIYLAG